VADLHNTAVRSPWNKISFIPRASNKRIMIG